MDRDSLELLLSQGLSLGQIGRRFGRDPNTVGYWVKKYGLRAVNVDKHAGRDGLTRADLEALIGEGLSVRQIAERTGFCTTTVRHWLKKHELTTRRGARRAHGREAKSDGVAIALMDCALHGRTKFRVEGRGAYRCLKCRQERVTARRRKVKAMLVAEAGGGCALCGYDRYAGALQFHHVDPATKSFHLGMSGLTRSLAAMRAEAAKCVLLCANCHAEVEADLLTLDGSADKVGEVLGRN